MNKKYLILGGVLIAIGGVGYLLYKKFVIDANKEKMATENISQPDTMAQAMAEAMVTSPIKPSTTFGSSGMSPVIAYSPSGEPISNMDLLLTR